MTIEKLLDQDILFMAYYKPRKDGSYFANDYHPFIALNKIINQGVIAYTGYTLDKRRISPINRNRELFVEGRCYMPSECLNKKLDRLIITKNIEEIKELFFNNNLDNKLFKLH